MKTTIQYNNENADINHANAIKDCKEYLGIKKYNICIAAIRNAYLSRGMAAAEGVANIAGIVSGIEGYPLEAMIKEATK